MVSKPWQDGSFSNEEDSTYPVDRTMDYVYDADVVNDLIDNNISYIIVSDPTDNKEMQVIQMATAFIWLLLTFFGIIGNGIVIYVILKSNKLANVTQCFMFNLAISDIAFLVFCVPLTAMTYLMDGWRLGDPMCKLYHYMTFVTVCATCFTLMTMTIDRYIFVCKINKPKWRTTMNVFYLSCLIWLASFVLSIPNMLTYNVNTQIYAVQSEHNTSHFTFEAYYECIQQSNRFTLSIQWFNTTISYFLPLFVLITCYMNILLFLARHSKRTILNTNARQSVRKGRRVTKTVIFITLTFMISWLPVHFLATWYRLDSNFPQFSILFVVKLIAHTMSYANSFVNPIIYAFSTDLFKSYMARVKFPFYTSMCATHANHCVAFQHPNVNRRGVLNESSGLLGASQQS